MEPDVSRNPVVRSGVTVIVCSRNRHEMLEQALPDVLAAAGASDHILVVDSASSGPETRDVAERLGVPCIRVDRAGLSRARNAGVRHATTDIVAFTDDDCRPDSGWLDALSEGFTASDVAFVTGRVRSSLDSGGGASVLDREEPARYVGVQEPLGIGHGANMAYRRSVLVDLGMFDERLGAGADLRSGEDVDMLFRCLTAGYAGRYEPAAGMLHVQWRSQRETLTLRYGYAMGNGAFRVKALRLGVPGAPRLLVRFLHQHGLQPTWRALRRGRPRPLLTTLLWWAGLAVGFLRGGTLPLAGPNFADDAGPSA